jgi:hypothetical protein
MEAARVADLFGARSAARDPFLIPVAQGKMVNDNYFSPPVASFQIVTKLGIH